MESSTRSQNIIANLNIEGNVIIKAYEGLIENPCRVYYELKKAFFAANKITRFDLIDSLIFSTCS